MPAEFVSGTIPVLSNAGPKALHLSNKRLPVHGPKIIIHVHDSGDSLLTNIAPFEPLIRREIGEAMNYGGDLRPCRRGTAGRRVGLAGRGESECGGGARRLSRAAAFGRCRQRAQRAIAGERGGARERVALPPVFQWPE